MNQIIVATHAKLAEGFYEAVKFFNRDIDHVHVINAYVDDADFEDVFLDTVKELKEDTVTVFTDILGGSVNQVAARHMKEYGYHLVSGTNLAVLLEAVFTVEDMTAKRLQEIVKAGNDQLVYVNALFAEADEEDETERR